MLQYYRVPNLQHPFVYHCPYTDIDWFSGTQMLLIGYLYNGVFCRLLNVRDWADGLRKQPK